MLPPNISSGSIVDITVAQNSSKESDEESKFRALQERIFDSFAAAEPSTPVLRCRNATQTSVVLEWDPIELATADLTSLSLYRNGQKAGNIPRPLQMHSTKISGLAVDAEYTFHLVLRTSAGTRTSDRVTVRTHKMTDLSGITITTGIMPSATKENLTAAVERIGAKLVDSVRIDTTHFVTTEGRGTAWEKAVETNIPVVRPEWVDACEESGRILGVTKFYLDAMRPGPPSEERPKPPPVPTKATETSPAVGKKEENGKKSSPETGAANKQDDNGDDDEEDDDEDEEEDEDEDEKDKSKSKQLPDLKVKSQHPDSSVDDKTEPKVKSPHPDEQKMRLEDKAEQKVAIRPSTSSKKSDAEKTEEDDEDEDDEDENEHPNNKTSRSPDGASFQEVEL